MEISLRDLLTVIHGMGFGALLLLSFPVILVELFRMSAPRLAVPSQGEQRALSIGLWVMAAVAWTTVLLGAYVIYPWYRAKPHGPGVDLADYPQRLLISSPTTSGWHNLGMEWKEHVAWLAPIAVTMAAYVFTKYGARLAQQRQIRQAVLGFVLVAFASAGVAGGFGAFLNKYAPVRGGAVIQIMKGDAE